MAFLVDAQDCAAGAPPDRLAKVVIRERAEHATYEGVVKLAGEGGKVISYRRVPARGPLLAWPGTSS